MYNRYLRNDQGVYTCIPQEEKGHPAPPPPPRQDEPRQDEPQHGGTPPERNTPPHSGSPPPPRADAPPDREESRGGAFEEGFRFLNGILEKLHLQDLDGADLMLLLLLFFLFEEKADDELLIALGLLLIL